MLLWILTIKRQITGRMYILLKKKNKNKKENKKEKARFFFLVCDEWTNIPGKSSRPSRASNFIICALLLLTSARSIVPCSLRKVKDDRVLRLG